MTITDNILIPFKIEIDDNNHTLLKKGVNGKGEEIWNTIGYFNDITGCLKKIISLKMCEPQNEMKLVEYLTYYQKIHNTMLLTIRNVMAKELVVKKETKYITKNQKS